MCECVRACVHLCCVHVCICNQVGTRNIREARDESSSVVCTHGVW